MKLTLDDHTSDTHETRALPTAHALPQEAKEAGIRDMPASEGYRRSEVPPESATRSSVYDHGVRFEQDCTNPITFFTTAVCAAMYVYRYISTYVQTSKFKC